MIKSIQKQSSKDNGIEDTHKNMNNNIYIKKKKELPKKNIMNKNIIKLKKALIKKILQNFKKLFNLL